MKNTYFITFQIENLLGDKLIFREFIEVYIDHDRTYGKFNQSYSIDDAIIVYCESIVKEKYAVDKSPNIELLSVSLILTEE